MSCVRKISEIFISLKRASGAVLKVTSMLQHLSQVLTAMLILFIMMAADAVLVI